VAHRSVQSVSAGSAIFIYGSCAAGISYLLAFFSDHLLKKRFLRLKRRFVAYPDRKPLIGSLQATLSRAVSPRRGRGSLRPRPRSPDPYFRRRRAAIPAAAAPAANNASVAGSGTGGGAPPPPPGGGGQRDGAIEQTDCACAGVTDKARRLPTAITAKVSFRIRRSLTNAEKPSPKIMQSSC
jgi:hypothetical protein